MADSPEEGLHRSDGLLISGFVPVLNSFFSTAKIGLIIEELVILKEEVVVGFPPVESLEEELRTIKWVSDLVRGGRYMMFAIIISEGRSVPVYVRFYVSLAGKLTIEDSGDNGASLQSEKEFQEPQLWKKVIGQVTSWGPTITKLILTYYSIVSDID